MSIIISLIGFNLLIVAHELGHYLVARGCGVHAHTVSIGFGPSILQWVGKHTQFRVCLFPIGGFVRFTSREQQQSDVLNARTDGLDHVSATKRILITLAGPAANVGLAVCVYSSLLMFDAAVVYRFQREQTTHLAQVGSIASAAGLRDNDLIVKVDGTSVRSFRDVAKLIVSDRPVSVLTIRREPGGRQVERRVENTRVDGLTLWLPESTEHATTLTISLGDRESRLEVLSDVEPSVARFGTTSVWRAFTLGLQETYDVTRAMGRLVGRWFDGTVAPEVQSVVRMTQVSARSFERGWSWFFSLLALFSMNLAVLNLLPLPGLDGGRLLVDVLESVSGRRLPPHFSRLMHAVGMLILLGLIAVVMVKEILDLIR
ncbi:MAG: M50 family metallopeptidase [Bradymonadia bacterium]